jgi:uncharacterized membrane protein
MKNTTTTVKQHLKNTFLSGILVVVPLGITLFILHALFSFVDGLLRPFIENYFHVSIPGLGIILTVLLVYLVGAITNNFVGKRVVTAWESFLGKMPLVSNIYSAVKQVMQTLSTQQKGYKHVVFVEYPRKGVLSVGFVTGEIQRGDVALLAIFIPAAINPTTGSFILIPESEVQMTDFTIEEGIKFALSSGIIAPEELREREHRIGDRETME